MALPVNSRTVAFTLVLILFISPVAADLSDSPPAILNNQPAESSPPYTIKLFIPTSSMIHSDQIKDQINGLNGDEVFFATSFGLSSYNYNEEWTTRHINRDNISAGLLDDYITAIEYDADGNLWLGYPGGIQIYNGRDYQTIRDQQILKDPRINDLQLWNNDMWVATGNAGIHRYHAGTWTWFQPMTKDGPGFYEIDSMVVDPVSNALVIATKNEGLWIIRSPENPIRFELLAGKFTSLGQMQHARRDPAGGVYFFDRSSVVHFRTDTGFVPVLTNKDLSPVEIAINDVAAAPDGKLYIGTDDGLFIWDKGTVYRHLNRFEGIGTSPAVRTVYVDAGNRVWFSTPGYVGYYLDAEPENHIRIDLVTPVPDQVSVQATQQASMTPPASPVMTGATPAGSTAGSGSAAKNSSIFDPVTGFINALSGIFGIRIFN
jgi:ligand-binding sensor domain-containing protein